MKAMVIIVVVLVLALAQFAGARELRGPGYDRLEAIADSVEGFAGEEVAAGEQEDMRLDRDAREGGDAILVTPTDHDRLPV